MSDEDNESPAIGESEALQPALRVILRRKSGSKIEDFPFELRPGERVFVLGANGTGKSALLLKLAREAEESALRVDAQRIVGFQTGRIDITAANREQAKEELKNTVHNRESRYYEEPHYGIRRVAAALFDLVNAQVQRDQRIAAAVDKGTDVTDIKATESPIAQLNRLLRSVQLPISLEVDGILSVNARRGDGPTFDIAALSDGQRAVLLLAANVLTAQPGQTLLIDEPERHLHRAISAPLLRDLFAERTDCAFVVATHEIELAADHHEARVLLTRDYRPEIRVDGGQSNGETWDLDWLEPDANLPEDLRRDVLGARRRILFVEGTETSLDRPLYALLFPGVSVLPKGVAADVIAATKALRHDIPHWLDACGLIDRDERDDAKVKALQADNVHVLKLNAVEALDLHPDVVAVIAARQCELLDGDPAELARDAVTEIITSIAAKREQLCARAIEMSVRNEVKSQLPTWKDISEGNPAPIVIKPAGRLDDERATFDKAVKDSDLVTLLTRYKVRETGAAASAAKKMRFRSVSDYRAAVRKLLKDDIRVRCKMRDLAPTLATAWPEGAE